MIKNNKGFTLIELLAVIVILSLLFGIGFTAVSKYINETRNTTYETYEKNMEDATKNMMTDCLKKNTENCIPANGKSKKIYLEDLETFKYSERLKDPEVDGGFCASKESFVVVTNSSGNETDLTYQVCLVCQNYQSGYCENANSIESDDCPAEEDKESPTCGITAGESTIWTNKDRVITVACSDDCMGCEKDSYSVRYSETTKTAKIKIKDNAEKETECPVNVYVDKGIPTCELQVTGTLNSETGWYGGNAPVVKWKTKTDGEGESGLSTYGLGLEKTNYNFDKEDTFTVSPGITTVYGYVKDKAGNVGICSVEVRYDSDKPVIKSVDYGYKVYPKEDISSASGSTITLNSITGEYGTIIGAYVYAKNGVGGQITFKNGSTELSKITMGSGVKKQRYKFNTSGNYNNITITLASSSQLNDIERIELLTDHTNGIYTNQNITMYINGSDSLSGKAEYSFDDGSIWSEDNSKVYSQNQASLKLKMRDRALNVSNRVTEKIDNIDKLLPSCELKRSITANGAGWNKADVKAQFKTTSDAASTSANAQSTVRDYSFNTTGIGNPKEQTQSSNTPKAGTKYTGYVIDKAGNKSSCEILIKLDKDDPTAGTIVMKETTSKDTISNNGYANENVQITLSNGSDALSGHKSTVYTIKKDGTAISKTSTNTYSDEGVYDVVVTTTDVADRTKTRSYKFIIDKTAPRLTVSAKYCTDYSSAAQCGNTQTGNATTATSGTLKLGGDGWTRNRGGAFTHTATDTYYDRTTWSYNSSGCYSGCDNVSGGGPSNASNGGTVTLTAKGIRYGVLTAYDKAGNYTTIKVRIQMDRDAPECKSSVSYATRDTNGVDITITCDAKGGSPCASNSQTGTYTNQTTSQTYTVYDSAGNSDSCGATVSTYTKYQRRTQSCAYDSCYYGENTCSYGCSTCGGTAYSCSYLDCFPHVAPYTSERNCKTLEGESAIWQNSQCCRYVSDTCYTSTYSCNCSSCYYGHNTCSGAYYSYGDWSGWSGYDYNSCNTSSCSSSSARIADCNPGTFYQGTAN